MATWRDHFRDFRPDGWPLCPCCGEEELWSPLIPSSPDFVASIGE